MRSTNLRSGFGSIPRHSFFTECIFEKADHVELAELSPLAQLAQQVDVDFLSKLGVSAKPLTIEQPKTTVPSQQKRSDDPNQNGEPDDIPF
jgi:hypothetical protein